MKRRGRDNKIEHSSHSYEQRLNRLGETDVTFVDRSYKPVSTWHITPPRDGDCTRSRSTGGGGGGGHVSSLRDIAARKLVANDNILSVLTAPLLRVSTWSQAWRHVWRLASLQGHDSFKLFILFASLFGQEKDFRCHHIPVLRDENDYSERERYLQGYLVSRKHRIEFIPEPKSSFAALLANLREPPAPPPPPPAAPACGGLMEHVVLLDLSRTRMDEQAYLDILSLKHLVALDVSCGDNDPITDGMLSLWRMALAEKWSELRLLCLGKRVSALSSSFMSLFGCKNLKYIEGPLVEPPQEWLHGKDVKGVSERFVSKYTLAQKHSFLRKYHGKSSEKRVMMEFIASESGPWVKTVNVNSTRHCYVRTHSPVTVKRSTTTDERQQPRVKKSKMRKLVIDSNGNMF